MSAKSQDKVIKRYPNGQVLIYYRHSQDNTTKVSMGFKTGSRSDEIIGITHYGEHMMFHNCMGKSEIELAKISADLNSKQNAYTGYDFVATDFDCPNKNLEKVIKINSKILQNRSYTEEEVNQEREVILQEMFRSNDEESDSLYQAMNILMEESPNKQISILGYEDTINSITREDLVNHQNNTYVAENLVVAVCSSLPYEEIERLMEKYVMYSFPSNKEAEFNKTLSVYKCHQNYMLQDNEYNCSTTEIDVMFRSNNNILKDYQYQPLESFIFNGMRGKLHDYLRLKHQLCYSSSFFNLGFDTLMYKGFTVTTTPKKINETLTTLADIVKEINENGISKQEFLAFKQFLKNQKERRTTFYQAVDTTSLLVSYIRFNDPFISVNIKDCDAITYEEANNHMKNIFKNTNIVVNIAGHYAKNKVLKKTQIYDMFGAIGKGQKNDFNLEEVIRMRPNDLYAKISTDNLTDKERVLALLVADYNEEKEKSCAKKVVKSHASSGNFSDEYQVELYGVKNHKDEERSL